MDDTSQTLLFKLKKGLRYTRLYGIRRTLAKVQGQYHMRKKYTVLPTVRTDGDRKSFVGLIGCGNYAYSNIAYYLNKNYGKVIHAAMDVDVNRAASMFEKYKLAYFTEDAQRIIEDRDVTLIYIASNHSTHAEYAIRALLAGKDVHIEKPHVVNQDQLVRLCEAMSAGKGRVLSVGFNRPYSNFGREIRRQLDRQAGTAMLNWFVAGHEIPPDHWYFKEEEGRRILGNLCHWTDFTYQMVSGSRYPIRINPTRWEKSDCDIAVNYVFGEGTIAAITFSAKGHTFEGVRERFSAHKGNVLITMDDFHKLVVDNVEKRTRRTPFYRDHGHEQSICNSVNVHRNMDDVIPPCGVDYVWETGELFLKTKEALESERETTVYGFEATRGDRALMSEVQV